MISAIRLLRIGSPVDQRKREHYRNCSLGHEGRALAERVAAHKSLKWESEPRWPRAVSPQLPGAFLNSLPSTPSGSICLTRAAELGVPGLSFLGVIHEFESVELSKLAPETQALSTGRAWL